MPKKEINKVMSDISANLCNQNRPEDHHFIFPHQQSSTFLLISLSVSYSCCFKYNLSTSRASVIGVGAVKAAMVLQRQQLKEKKRNKKDLYIMVGDGCASLHRKILIHARSLGVLPFAVISHDDGPSLCSPPDAAHYCILIC